MTILNPHTPLQSTPLLEARDLTCIRGQRALFEGLSFGISSGECLHVSGENGVGKTSLLRLLSGLSRPELGEVLWDGKSIVSDSVSYRHQLLYMGHRDALKEDLTSLENLEMYAVLDNVALSQENALATLWRFGLRGREDLPVSCLSAGQKRRVLMARMITRQAKIWILDEPFNALDSNAVQILQKLIEEHIDAGGIVILTSHQALVIEGLRVLKL
jgi:heme exporter protein A